MATIAEALDAARRLHQSGDLAEAKRRYLEILERQNDNPEAWHLLGVAEHGLGDQPAALAHLKRAIALDGGQASFHVHLAEVYRALGQRADAEQSCRRAVEIDGDHAEAHFKLGVILQQQRQWPAAADSYQNAIRCRANYVEAYNNLGTLHKWQHHLDAAIACYAKALEFQPDFAEVLNNLGNIFKTQGRLDEAAVCYERALQLKPDNAQAHYNRSLLLLGAGQFAAGWCEYEWRSRCPEFVHRSWARPAWRGEPLAGRRLLIHAEQGLGDTLQFIRYVPLLPREAGEIAIEAQASLVPLLAQAGFDRLIPRGATLPEFDLQVPLLSLPGILGTTLDNVPDRVPYLTADPRRVEHWRSVLGAIPELKVGIAWQGSPTHPNDYYRSISLAHFEPLAQSGVELIRLQQGPGAEQAAALAERFPLRDLGPGVDRDRGAFMDTAAIMRSLDLVITSDTAVAHLAGALGVEVWVALGLSPDWRWMHARDSSPWYPTMRLFRQTRFDDWSSVFAGMAKQLRAKLVASEKA